MKLVTNLLVIIAIAANNLAVVLPNQPTNQPTIAAFEQGPGGRGTPEPGGGTVSLPTGYPAPEPTGTPVPTDEPRVTPTALPSPTTTPEPTKTPDRSWLAC